MLLRPSRKPAPLPQPPEAGSFVSGERPGGASDKASGRRTDSAREVRGEGPTPRPTPGAKAMWARRGLGFAARHRTCGTTTAKARAKYMMPLTRKPRFAA